MRSKLHKKTPVKYPKISILTPTYNAATFLQKSIKSVIAQNYPSFEYIIADAGSHDNTLAMINDYKSHIKILDNHHDIGPTDAFNQMIKIATGDIICMLSADDWLSAETLNYVASTFIQNPDLDVVSVLTDIYQKQNHTLQHINRFSKTETELTLSNVLQIPLTNARFIKKSLFKELGYFNIGGPTRSEYITSSDYEFMIKLALKKPRSITLDFIGYNFLVHENSLTSANNWEKKLKIKHENIQTCYNLLKNEKIQLTDKKIIKQALLRHQCYIITRLPWHRDLYALKNINFAELQLWLTLVEETFIALPKKLLKKPLAK